VAPRNCFSFSYFHFQRRNFSIDILNSVEFERSRVRMRISLEVVRGFRMDGTWIVVGGNGSICPFYFILLSWFYSILGSRVQRPSAKSERVSKFLILYLFIYLSSPPVLSVLSYAPRNFSRTYFVVRVEKTNAILNGRKNKRKAGCFVWVFLLDGWMVDVKVWVIC